jgi:hypothetical protein
MKEIKNEHKRFHVGDVRRISDLWFTWNFVATSGFVRSFVRVLRNEW